MSEQAEDVTIVANHRWAEGQMTRCAPHSTSRPTSASSAIVIGLADQPFVTPDAWRTVATGPGPITVATYAGRRGNPVGLDRRSGICCRRTVTRALGR